MRHRKHRHTLGVTKEHRKALLSNLAAALFIHGRIETTLTKAKALRPFAEKIITMAREAANASPQRALALRRLAVSRVRNRDAVAMLFNERAAEFANRAGGYTRIYKLGPRIGDAAEMALIALIDASDEGYTRSKRRSKSGRPSTASTGAEQADSDSDAAAADSDAQGIEDADAATPEAPGDDTPGDEEK